MGRFKQTSALLEGKDRIVRRWRLILLDNSASVMPKSTRQNFSPCFPFKREVKFLPIISRGYARESLAGEVYFYPEMKILACFPESAKKWHLHFSALSAPVPLVVGYRRVIHQYMPLASGFEKPSVTTADSE